MADHSRGFPSDGTDYQSLPNAVVALLPTPAVNDMGAAYTPDEWDEWTATMKAKHNNGNGHGKSLNVEVQRLLPTPTVQDGANNGGPSQFERNTRPLNTEVLLLPTPKTIDTTGVKTSERAKELYSSKDSMGDIIGKDSWGEYAPAIRRWEALTRPAPAPTKLSPKGVPKLSDEFDEWFMGYPAGWITDVPGVTWNETLKACGNGVVPQQGAAAVRWLRLMASWVVAA